LNRIAAFLKTNRSYTHEYAVLLFY